MLVVARHLIMLVVFSAVVQTAALLNTDWRVVLNVGDQAPATRGQLPLPLSLRFSGEEVASHVDTLLSKKGSARSLMQRDATASVVTMQGEQRVPFSAVGWVEDVIDRQSSLLWWSLDFPTGARKGGAELPAGRVYCSIKRWLAADLDAKCQALDRLRSSMSQLECALEDTTTTEREGLSELLQQLNERRRLDERIVSLESELPDAEVLAVPGSKDVVVAKEGSLSVRRERAGPLGFISRLLGADDAADFEQIGTFSLRPIPAAEIV